MKKLISCKIVFYLGILPVEYLYYSIFRYFTLVIKKYGNKLCGLIYKVYYKKL